MARGKEMEAGKDHGLEECLAFPEPVQAYREKVFFRTLAAETDGRTFVALLNRNTGDGQPLGIVVRWSQNELPILCEWKMPCKGFYVLGLEPSNVLPLGRGVLREQGSLPMIEGQASRDVTIDFEVLDSLAQFEEMEKQARKLAG